MGVAARLAAVLTTLLEYVPILLTIAIATYVGLATTGPSTDQGTLLQWVIVLLGLIATSILVERFTRLRRMDVAIRNISNLFSAYMSERIRATDFFLDEPPPLLTEVESASSIMVFAVNAQAFLVEHKNAITERIREGAELRVLVVDPVSDSAEKIANPEKELSVEYLRATAQIAKQTLAWLDRQRDGHGSVELRYCDYVPMFSAYAFDRHSHRGKITVGLYRQFWSHERRPYAILTKLRDGYWYDYYHAQMEEAWERGVPVPL